MHGTQELERIRQDICRRLVEREVIANVSGLVSKVIELDEDSREHYVYDAPPEWDDVADALTDYGIVFLAEGEGEGPQAPVDVWRKHGPTGPVVEWAPVETEDVDENATLTPEALAESACSGEWFVCELRDGLPVLPSIDAGDGHSTRIDAIKAAAEADRVDLGEYQREIYEWWLVSGWLADQLREHGEHVPEGDCVQDVWGRTCSGQAILLDGVIREIAAETWPDEWAPAGEPSR